MATYDPGAYLQSDFYKNLKAKAADASADEATRADAASRMADIDKQMFQSQYGGMGQAALSDFQTLLGRLETSKIRQQREKDISARPNIYAQGLAQMMQNF
jgi:hypothetical protein